MGRQLQFTETIRDRSPWWLDAHKGNCYTDADLHEQPSQVFAEQYGEHQVPLPARTLFGHCPESRAPVYAVTKVRLNFTGSSCLQVVDYIKTRVANQNASSPWVDPRNSNKRVNWGSYTKRRNRFDAKKHTLELKVDRVSAYKEWNDEILFYLKGDVSALASSCEMHACSVTQEWSTLDNYRNFCNINNLLCSDQRCDLQGQKKLSFTWSVVTSVSDTPSVGQHGNSDVADEATEQCYKSVREGNIDNLHDVQDVAGRMGQKDFNSMNTLVESSASLANDWTQ